ncbi:choice-of-anchor A family protein [Paenibacillus rhizoplanae]
MAAGGNVTTSSSGIASSFTGDPHTLDALVVGGNLNISNDSVNGNVIVGGNFNDSK